ncbi:MAG TPA: electron transport complex subunit RsxE [Treponemataceae bacterium]|jgi:electron transport complex protein RnfE|nr:MAG: Electron transport complex protein RnfE [Spirochaetes bacterium ADurb.Bin269]TAH55723.1 MAG: RnfABCDGE type electron transport complex subunit E [Treponema sp.]HOC28247.1 electron transport complex subunit RsxE [Treponemataceae bacterium]HPX47501.1 electron transport complex subunit RsxE [Treponemataceae bacterium]HQL32405.1 electron transport complex subunit RsxE [Treponemataceae bacterium]
MKKYIALFTNGLLKENPLLTLMIGLCSSLAVTTAVSNGIGMGLAMTFVLLMSEILISLFRKIIPDSIRIPVFIIIIATFTTIVDLMMKAYTPELSRSMGVFIPLIVVNCIIMGRVEAFASKNRVGEAVADALGMGLGYTWVLVGISIVRELLGAGTLLNIRIIPEAYTIGFFAKAPGGFFVFALFISINLAVNRMTAAGKGGAK